MNSANSEIAQVSPNPQRHAVRMLVGGILGMMVAMGIGRFAYTPILPLMQRDLGISHSLAGWLAALNLAGYLGGALLCAVRPTVLRSSVVNAGALLTSIGSTFFMGATLSPIMWGALRLSAGVASALLFVAIAIEVSETVMRSSISRWNSALYGGIGLGIAISGALVPLFDRIGGWRDSWYGMGTLALFLAISGVIVAGKRTIAPPVRNEAETTGSVLSGITILACAYLLEGFSYIISATFLVTIIAHTPGLAPFASWSWVAVGLAAAPSTVIWQQLSLKIGARPTLTTAFLLQAGGILLSSVSASVFTAGLAAIIFGGTFLGIVALVMAEGGRRAGSEGRRATAILTVCFGIGQIAGPLVAGFLADSHGFALPLQLAGVLVVVGGALVATDKGFTRKPL